MGLGAAPSPDEERDSGERTMGVGSRPRSRKALAADPLPPPPARNVTATKDDGGLDDLGSFNKIIGAGLTGSRRNGTPATGRWGVGLTHSTSAEEIFRSPPIDRPIREEFSVSDSPLPPDGSYCRKGGARGAYGADDLRSCGVTSITTPASRSVQAHLFQPTQ